MSCPHALQRDPGTGLWRCDAPALSLQLLARTDGALAVRPPGQPRPPHLPHLPAGSVLGRLFGLWLRQRDDAGHAEPKAALARALAALDPAEVQRQTRRQADLARREDGAGDWNHWAWAVPASSIGALLGLALDNAAAQRRLRERLQAIGRGLAGADLAAADAAATKLLAELQTADPAAPLQQALARHAPAAVWQGGDAFEANRLALLWQSFEASAALLANALAQLAATPALRRPGHLRAWLPTLIDAGGAVLNTRRFAQRELQIGETILQAGDGLLLAIAGESAGFGAGPHRCPGQDLALQSAAAALEQLLDDPPDAWPQRAPDDLVLPNARLPQFMSPLPGARHP